MSNDNRVMTSSDPHGEMQLPSADGAHLATVDHGHAPVSRRQNLLHILHLSLRGRYWLVVPLSLMLCATGVIIGWKEFSAKYRSVGRIHILYKIPTVDSNNQIDYLGEMKQYDEFMNTQIGVIMSQDRIWQALRDPDWMKTPRGSDNEAMKKFIDNLTVEHPHQTQLLDVAYIDSDPFIAATGTRAVVRIYKEWNDAKEKAIADIFYNSLMGTVADKKAKIEETKRAINVEVGRHGSEDFDMLIRNETLQVVQRKEQLEKLKSYLSELESNGDPSALIDRFSNEDIGMFDGRMQAKLDQIGAAQARVQDALLKYGENHDTVKALRKNVENAQQAADEYAQHWRLWKKKLGGPLTSEAPDRGGNREDAGGARLAQTPDAVKKMIVDCQDRLNKSKDDLADYSAAQLVMRGLKDNLETLKHELADAQRKLANYQNEENHGMARLIVLDPGAVPIQPYKDPRKPAAAGLGLAGLMLPILLFFLIGVADRRFRFSDQADADGHGLPPLLGILPTLPDRLEDPEPAAMAAHCVHQLRIMLQVNTANTASADGGSVPMRRAYVITSASPGDGKTSLTMALGLSYAASGSRTLVIDCDMIGQGLTNRLKANSTEGLLEALQAGTLAGRVKKTTTANLYILPIGGAESTHAGALSPQTIRKLLVEARRIFDVVIIDTGPILGSLEAQVVSAAADSVILTVARGQQQPLVQRALRMLRQIGASVGGMVFNRAQQRDFERSMTSSSIRSMGDIPASRRALLSEGAEESRFGPLARSVASFMPNSPANSVPNAAASKTSSAAASAKPGEIRVEVVSTVVEAPAAQDTVYGAEPPAGDQGTENPQ